MPKSFVNFARTSYFSICNGMVHLPSKFNSFGLLIELILLINLYSLNKNFISVGYYGPLTVLIYFLIWSMINGPLAKPKSDPKD